MLMGRLAWPLNITIEYYPRLIDWNLCSYMLCFLFLLLIFSKKEKKIGCAKKRSSRKYEWCLLSNDVVVSAVCKLFSVLPSRNMVRMYSASSGWGDGVRMWIGLTNDLWIKLIRHFQFRARNWQYMIQPQLFYFLFPSSTAKPTMFQVLVAISS